MQSSQDEPTGFARLRSAALNKSTAFTEAERDRYGLRGLLPARVCSQDVQIERVLLNLRRKTSDIERYIFLLALQGRTERLFYRTLVEHIEEVLPVVYTPTVGEACQQFAHIFRQPRGFYVTPNDRGRIRENLRNWPEEDVRIVVVTDGERILGLGDLGANGMGIPIGKLSLYTACAGIDPRLCLPVQIDVGTNNRSLREDPLYMGVMRERLTGEPYYAVIDEFVEPVHEAFPRALIQFEDFLTPNAYELLRRYRNRVLCFNDDIQGTAAVALAGVYGAGRITGHAFKSRRVMFLGAGSAATGIADLMTQAFISEGLTEADARARLWFVDAHGLVVRSRTDLLPHNLPYAHDQPGLSFLDAIRAFEPSVLIGATGRPGTFTEAAIGAMAAINERPVIFALSNPTSRAECTPAQAYAWSAGRVVFASGSPFPPLELDSGETWRPAQGNNVYIFPGVGLGATACQASTITDGMFLVAARALADQVGEDDLAARAVYPRLPTIRSVSLAVAVAVAEQAYREGVTKGPQPTNLRERIASSMYDPAY